MTSEEFEAIWSKITADEKRLLTQKGHEYTKGNPDRLANFKGIGEEVNVTPLKVWYVYFKKHVDAIASYVKYGKVKSNEPIESRFADARNYLLLGLALLEDGRNDKNKD